MRTDAWNMIDPYLVSYHGQIHQLDDVSYRPHMYLQACRPAIPLKQPPRGMAALHALYYKLFKNGFIRKSRSIASSEVSRFDERQTSTYLLTATHLGHGLLGIIACLFCHQVKKTKEIKATKNTPNMV